MNCRWIRDVLITIWPCGRRHNRGLSGFPAGLKTSRRPRAGGGAWHGAALGLLAAATLLLVPGCQTLRDIDRAAARINEQLKARQLARRRSYQATARRCQVAGDVIRLAGADIDTAYVRLKRFFNYRSLNEYEPADRKWIKYMGFRHETLPGVRYNLAQTVRWPTYGDALVWLHLILERDTGGVRIQWQHCAGADGWEHLPPGADRIMARDIRAVALGRGR